MAKALICDSCGKTYPHHPPKEESQIWNTAIAQPVYRITYAVKRTAPEERNLDWCPECVGKKMLNAP